MAFSITLTFSISKLFGSREHSVSLNSGLTTFLGPNGSGKTQLLRFGARTQLEKEFGKVRFLSSGRLSYLDTWRGDQEGTRGPIPNYEDAHFGNEHLKHSRHESESILGDLHTLSVRPDVFIKVSTRLKCLFERGLSLNWRSGQLKAELSRESFDPTDFYNASREASGLLHLVSILTALYDETIKVLILDEPEISLHPQLQSFLLQELLSHSGHPREGKKLVLLGTHSPSFLHVRKPSDFCNLIFVDSVTGPMQISAKAEELKAKGLKSLSARLGYEHRAALFADRPMLVEGDSDLIILSELDNLFGFNLSTAGGHITPVGGKEEIAAVLKLLRLCGKAPIVLADLDAFIDSDTVWSQFCNDVKANLKAQNYGHRSLAEMISKFISDFKMEISNSWSEIKDRAEEHYYWKNQKDEGKAKYRAAAAVLLQEETTLNVLSQPLSVLRSRLIAVLDVLEASGCFFLRMGTIESYYALSRSTENKTLNAIEEVEKWESFKPAEIEKKYADVIRALEYAAKQPVINENDAVRDLVLAIACPSLNYLGENQTGESLKRVACSNVDPHRASLIKLAVIQNFQREFVLHIDLQSDILDRSAFPICIPRGGNPLEIVNRQFDTNSSKIKTDY